MEDRRVVAAALAVVVVILAVVAGWRLRAEPHPPPPPPQLPPPAPAVAEPAPGVPTAQPSTPPVAPAQVEPGPVAVAHQLVAQRLGVYAVRCYVGERYDDRQFMGFFYRPVVENGWFTALVEEPQGGAVLEVTTTNGEPDAYETLPIQIRWSVPEGATEGPCTVEALAKATLIVEIEEDVDAGETLPGVPAEIIATLPRGYSAGGCGFYANGDAPNLEGEVYVVYTEPSCELQVSSILHSATVSLSAMVPGEERRVTVVLEPGELDLELQDDAGELSHDLDRWTQEAENLAEVLLEIPEGPGREQVERMRRHRLMMADLKQDHLDELDETPPTLEEPP